MPDPLVPTLTNPRSDRVRAVRALAGRPARSRHGQLLVEGPQGVREAVRHAAGRVRDVYLTPAAVDRYAEESDDTGTVLTHSWYYRTPAYAAALADLSRD